MRRMSWCCAMFNVEVGFERWRAFASMYCYSRSREHGRAFSILSFEFVGIGIVTFKRHIWFGACDRRSSASASLFKFSALDKWRCALEKNRFTFFLTLVEVWEKHAHGVFFRILDLSNNGYQYSHRATSPLEMRGAPEGMKLPATNDTAAAARKGGPTSLLFGDAELKTYYQ